MTVRPERVATFRSLFLSIEKLQAIGNSIGAVLVSSQLPLFPYLAQQGCCPLDQLLVVGLVRPGTGARRVRQRDEPTPVAWPRRDGRLMLFGLIDDKWIVQLPEGAWFKIERFANNFSERRTGRIEELDGQSTNRNDQARVNIPHLKFQERSTQGLFLLAGHSIAPARRALARKALGHGRHILSAPEVNLTPTSVSQPLEETSTTAGVEWTSSFDLRHAWRLADDHDFGRCLTGEDRTWRDVVAGVQATSASPDATCLTCHPL